MPDSNQMSPKASFILGLFGGIAVISTVGFFILLPKVLNLNGNGANPSGNNPTAQQPKNTGNQELPPPADVPAVTKDDHILGDEDAPITLVEYSDFECPFCLRHKPTVDQIMANYKGKVRLVYRHFPLSFHPQAQKAAEASECAAEQGKFWEMHDKIFEANGQGVMSVEKWKTFASELKLNTSKFNDCLDTGKTAGKVQEQYNGGVAAGVQGTPATFVNGQLVSGAVPYEDFKQLLDSLL